MSEDDEQQIGLHTLRHTYVSKLINQGESIRYVTKRSANTGCSLLAVVARAVARPVGRARGDRQREPALMTLQLGHLPSALERGGLRRFVEVVTHAAQYARGDRLSHEVDAEFKNGNAARQRMAHVLE